MPGSVLGLLADGQNRARVRDGKILEAAYEGGERSGVPGSGSLDESREVLHDTWRGSYRSIG